MLMIPRQTTTRLPGFKSISENTTPSGFNINDLIHKNDDYSSRSIPSFQTSFRSSPALPSIQQHSQTNSQRVTSLPALQLKDMDTTIARDTAIPPPSRLFTPLPLPVGSPSANMTIKALTSPSPDCDANDQKEPPSPKRFKPNPAEIRMNENNNINNNVISPSIRYCSPLAPVSPLDGQRVAEQNTLDNGYIKAESQSPKCNGNKAQKRKSIDNTEKSISPASASTAGPEKSASSLAVRRHLHILSEQRRRESINGGFVWLKNAVPATRGSHDSKAAVLRKAVSYIEGLEYELESLKYQLFQFQQQQQQQHQVQQGALPITPQPHIALNQAPASIPHPSQMSYTVAPSTNVHGVSMPPHHQLSMMSTAPRQMIYTPNPQLTSMPMNVPQEHRYHLEQQSKMASDPNHQVHAAAAGLWKPMN